MTEESECTIKLYPGLQGLSGGSFPGEQGEL